MWTRSKSACRIAIRSYGPAIQAAVDSSLKAGTRIGDVMANVGGVVGTGAPTLVMSYWNPIERYGVDRFARELAEAAGCGVITPDLTLLKKQGPGSKPRTNMASTECSSWLRLLAMSVSRR